MGLEHDFKAAGESVRVAGNTIVDAMKKLTDELADMKLAYRDHQTQLLITNQSMLAVRTEIFGRIDTLETRVLTALDEVARQLAGISKQLGTNGSGGHHG